LCKAVAGAGTFLPARRSPAQGGHGRREGHDVKAAIKTGIACGLAVLAMALPSLAQTSPLEAQVKAAYLSKFSPFLDWPAGTFATPDAPLVICVVGEDTLGANLDRALAGQKDREHPLTVRRLAEPAEAQGGCHILFTADAAIAGEALAAVASQPVLTVTDMGLPVQGMISFVRVGNNLRFDIDEAQAQGAGLVISSKLLVLARNVRRGAR